MMEKLADILRKYGLELNADKTKILSTAYAPDREVKYHSRYGSIEHIARDSAHRYLGRRFPGDLRNRGSVAVEYRIVCAWIKYNQFRHVLEDKMVSIRVRFKLFDSIVSSTVLYSLDSCPISSKLEDRLNVVHP